MAGFAVFAGEARIISAGGGLKDGWLVRIERGRTAQSLVGAEVTRLKSPWKLVRRSEPPHVGSYEKLRRSLRTAEPAEGIHLRVESSVVPFGPPSPFNGERE